MNPFLLFLYLGVVHGFRSCKTEKHDDFIYAMATELDLRSIVVVIPPKANNVSQKKLAVTLAKRQQAERSGHFQVAAHTYDQIEKVQERCRSLYVVIADNTTIKELHLISNKRSLRNSAWLLYFQYPPPSDSFDKLKLTLEKQLFIAWPESHSTALHSTVAVTEIHRVTPTFPIKSNPVGTWSSQTGQNFKIDSFSKRRSDFGGLTLRIGTIENWPISSFSFGQAGKDRIIDGLFPSVWWELQDILNFTSVYFRSDKWGIKLTDRDCWTGLFGMMLREDIEVILTSVTMSAERQLVSDTLYPLSSSRLTVYYQPGDFKWDWTPMFRPFASDVWLALLIWMATAATFLQIFSWTANKYGIVGRNEPASNQHGFFVLQTICSQGSSNTPTYWGARIIFICCYLVSAVLLPSFSASLISYLTQRTPPKPFHDLTDMLDAKFSIFVGQDMFSEEFFVTSTDPMVQRARREILETTSFTSDVDIETIYKRMCKGEGGMFTSDNRIHVTMKDYVKGCRPTGLDKPVIRVQEGIALSKGSPYKEVLNYNILRLSEFGHLARLKKKYLNHPTNHDETAIWRAVNDKDVAEIFIFLVISMFVSLLILGGEKLFHYFTK